MSFSSPLWKLEFGHGVGDEGLIDFLQVLGGGIEEAGRGDVVDQPGDAACIIMDEGFGFGFEDLVITSCGSHSGVDIGTGLVFGECKEVTSNGDSVDKIAQAATGEELGEGFLAAEEDLYGDLGIDRRAHQEA